MNKIGTKIKNVIITLKKENINLAPYISDGSCMDCYFYKDGNCKRSRLDKTCYNYSFNNCIVSVIYKETKMLPKWAI